MKKKISLIIGIIAICIIIVGVVLLNKSSLFKGKSFTCDYKTIDEEKGYEILSTYQVNYQKDIVNKITYNTTMTSKNKDMLEDYEVQIKDLYKTLDDIYSGFKYETKMEKEKMIGTVVIDYNKIDTKKYAEDHQTLQEFMNSDNKFTVSGIKKMYSQQGIVCKNENK